MRRPASRRAPARARPTSRRSARYRPGPPPRRGTCHGSIACRSRARRRRVRAPTAGKRNRSAAEPRGAERAARRRLVSTSKPRQTKYGRKSGRGSSCPSARAASHTVAPEAATSARKELLHEAHPDAAVSEPAQLDRPSPRRGIRRIQLVDAELGAACCPDIDQQVPEDAVDEPGRTFTRRRQRRPLANATSSSRAVVAPGLRAAPGSSVRRTAPRRGTTTGWLCQYASRLRSRSGRRRNGLSHAAAAERHVAAPAGAGVAAIEHEFLGTRRARRGLLGRDPSRFREAAPALRRVDVHPDHARVGRHREPVKPRVTRRRGALDHDR